MVGSGTQGHSLDNAVRDNAVRDNAVRDNAVSGKIARDNLDQGPGDHLNDDALESEIELVSELVVAATSSDRPLHQEEVDLLLGIKPREDQPEDQPKRPEM